jgi:hypothetical protein
MIVAPESHIGDRLAEMFNQFLSWLKLNALHRFFMPGIIAHPARSEAETCTCATPGQGASGQSIHWRTPTWQRTLRQCGRVEMVSLLLRFQKLMKPNKL